MKAVAATAAILVAVGALLVSVWLFLPSSAPQTPKEPVPLAYAPGPASSSPLAEPTPSATPLSAMPTSTAIHEPGGTPSPSPTPMLVTPTPTPTVAPPIAQSNVEEEAPGPAEPAPAKPSPSPAMPPRGVYPSPGIGSPEAVAMEEKTLAYLNWARGRQGIPPYRMNPEMQALAREHALLYVETRESTGQYPPADKIGAATRARGWFFEDGGGPDPNLWLHWSYEEMERGYSLRYEPFYRNPKGSDMGIGFAFYSGRGVFGGAGGTVVVFVWNGEWDE